MGTHRGMPKEKEQNIASNSNLTCSSSDYYVILTTSLQDTYVHSTLLLSKIDLKLKVLGKWYLKWLDKIQTRLALC